jgi:hypothetical protein
MIKLGRMGWAGTVAHLGIGGMHIGSGRKAIRKETTKKT